MNSAWQGFKKRLSTAQKERDISLSPFHRRFQGRLPATMVNDKIYINDEHRYIFFRIPKNANSFIIANLLLLQNGSRLSLPEVDMLKTRQSSIHLLTWKEAEKKLNTYFTFLVVRNPYSRVASAYLDKIVREKPPIMKVRNRLGLNAVAPISFKQFVEYLLIEGALLDDSHWAPQSDLVPLSDYYFNFVARFETLVDDTAFILQTIYGRSLVTPLAQEHATNASSMLVDLYDDDLIDSVHQLYRQDFNRFGYSSQPFWLS